MDHLVGIVTFDLHQSNNQNQQETIIHYLNKNRIPHFTGVDAAIVKVI